MIGLMQILRTPSEVLKTKEQVDQSESTSPARSSWRLMRDVYRSGGAGALTQLLYGSYSSNLFYALPADVIKFLACKCTSTYISISISSSSSSVTSSHDTSRREVSSEDLREGVWSESRRARGRVGGSPRRHSRSSSHHSGARHPSPLSYLSFYFFAVPQLDVARVRIMTTSEGKESEEKGEEKGKTYFEQASPVEEMRRIYRKDGVAGLFVGLAPRLVRAVASGAVQFASYEVAQNWLNKL